MVHYYLKASGIRGGGKDLKHIGWIDILSYHFGTIRRFASEEPSGRRSDHHFFDFVFVMYLNDPAYPRILLRSLNNSFIDRVTVECVSGNKVQIRLEMTKVVLCDVKPTVAKGSVGTAEVSCSYESVKQTCLTAESGGEAMQPLQVPSR